MKDIKGHYFGAVASTTEAVTRRLDSILKDTFGQCFEQWKNAADALSITKCHTSKHIKGICIFLCSVFFYEFVFIIFETDPVYS